jgi:hypothetical protein
MSVEWSSFWSLASIARYRDYHATHLISSEPLFALEEPRSSANHCFVNVVSVAAADDNEVGVVAGFE